ncbi:MAG: hypothetical protein V2I54_05075 [Bacteroidales bacterium]|nr:hypothetical protein [Bacteroidales bacterium]
MKKIIVLLWIGFLFGCTNENPESVLNVIAEDYVKLVLEVGQYDPNFVDAYYGPDEWKPKPLSEELSANPPYDVLLEKSSLLLGRINKISPQTLDESLRLRHLFLQKQLIAVKGRIEMLSGKNFSFDEETKVLYDVVTPDYTVEHFQSLIDELDQLLPGTGSLTERLSAFKKQFIIPEEKLDTVFHAAIREARKRTLDYIDLPANENFKLEFVTDKPWGGYNWYKGNNFSLIQINTDLPIYIDRAIDLASHEGYPGHHVFACLLESRLVKSKGWVEYSVYPLFSPQSLIAEGTANYGIEMAFPSDGKIKFEKEVLFPLAGLDPGQAERYYQVLNLVSEISYVRNAAAEAYLDGEMSREETIEWLVKYALRDRRGAAQSLKFIETYRSYVINYNVGLDMVKAYMEEKGGESAEDRWETFEYLISTPQVPSNLVE